jgi:hypothetical protein
MTDTKDTHTGDTGAPVLQVIDGGRASDKLTGKQSAFVHAVLKGANQSDAYRLAYNAENMSDSTIWNEASKLFANPKVSARIKAGQRRQEAAAVHSGLSLRQHVERELYALSTKADTDQSRLRALELLGKTEKCGIFLERTAELADDRERSTAGQQRQRY